MAPIRVSHTSGVPIYKQIVDQVEFMIEAGQLKDGDRLPSSRMLASNLDINRNTVARSYRELRELGHVESQRRRGMVVVKSAEARDHARAVADARESLADAVRGCIVVGLSPEEASSLAYHFGLDAEELEVRISFVECNAERASYFADELSKKLNLGVRPLVLGEFDAEQEMDVDLLLTTFFHLSEVRKLSRPYRPEVVAIVVAPHVQTLVQLAQVPKSQSVGVLYSTEDQAVSIRDSLVQSGIQNIEVLSQDTDQLRRQLPSVNTVVVPSELPELRELLNGKTSVIEYGNVLDQSSIRMVSEVVDEIRDRKASSQAR